MATAAQWLEGARLRTFPNAIAPIVVGSAAAEQLGHFSWWQSLLALVVALGLIIGVNFANDYSDGIRGTDDDRVGPFRLVGSRSASPKSVRNAAFGCFGIALVAGLALIIATGHWWMLALGAASVTAAWFYTGGRNPYGYKGFGEIAVFLFFGLVAVLGTTYVQAGELSWFAGMGAVSIGAFSAAVLVVNNIRDIDTDKLSGKVTLAVRMGDERSRIVFRALNLLPIVLSALSAFKDPWLLLGFVALALIIPTTNLVANGATGRALIPALKNTGLSMLLWSIATGVALVLA